MLDDFGVEVHQNNSGGFDPWLDVALEEPEKSQDEIDKAIEEEMEKRGATSKLELAKMMIDEMKPQEGEVVEAPIAEPVEQKHIKEGGPKLNKDAIVSELTDSFVKYGEMITFLNESKNPVMYTRRDIDGDTMPFYRCISRMEVESMVHNFTKNRGDLHHLAVPAVSHTTNAVVDTIAQDTLRPGADRMNGLVCVGIDAYSAPIYYDTVENKLVVGEEDADRPCFFHLCDTPAKQSGVPKINFNDLDTETIQKYAKQAEEDIKAYREQGTEYPQRFASTFGAWADGDPDLYVDLLTVSALPLFNVKPPKIFFALGSAANGKSTWRHLLQTIYGTENTASVSTKQMGDWSYTATLDAKLLNFPDEDDVQAALDTPFFKSIASHDTVNFAKKGSSEPLRIKCDFVSIIPMNREPEWTNIDGGIMRRICILPFNHDFSAEDSNVTTSFEESTYTPELVAQLIGEFIGIAQYYAHSGTELKFSGITSRANNEFVETHDNIKLFKQQFERVFIGYSGIDTLYECYEKWCAANDYTPVDKGRVKMAYRNYTETKYCRIKGRQYRVAHPKDTKGRKVDINTALTMETVVPYMSNEAGGFFNKPVYDLFKMGIDPVTAALSSAEEKRSWA